ncbi:MAG: FG-GAP-like repeat-containing protein, partial [bacterium]|nr:FG-GAP-like repeat-containing protein [bacterium]
IDVIGCVWGSNRISWWENDGAENFTEHILASNFTFAHWVHAADLDSDGDHDILGAAYGANEIAWWENDGNRNFVKRTICNSFANVTSVFGKDLDGDGDVDVLSAAETANQIRWWENDGAQHFTEHIIANNFAGASHAHPEDLDGDGDMDVIGASRFGHKVTWWESIDIFLMPDFVARTMTGHAPLAVQFKDSSFARPAVTAWQWDFNNDGTIDAQEQTPAFSYEQPGTYTVRLIVSNDSLSQTITRENYIQVFDGESALSFDGKAGMAKCPATPTLNLTSAATFEAWINPGGWGSLANMGFGRIVDKKNISLLLNGQGGSLHPHSLVVWLATTNGTAGFACTPENSISLNQWQHVAMTYDGASSVARIFINGIEQTVTQKSGQFSGAIVDNIAIDLRIGNGATPFIFDGAIDEVRVWQTMRSSQEIQSNMSHYLKGDEAGLIGYWQMNEGNGLTISDKSGHNHSGILDKAKWIAGNKLEKPVGVEMNQHGDFSVPEKFSLDQNYPNPFNSSTTIQFHLPRASHLSLKIFDVTGRLVATLADNQNWQAGSHSIHWEGRDYQGKTISSGVYLVALETRNFKQTRKMIYLK